MRTIKTIFFFKVVSMKSSTECWGMVEGRDPMIESHLWLSKVGISKGSL